MPLRPKKFPKNIYPYVRETFPPLFSIPSIIAAIITAGINGCYIYCGVENFNIDFFPPGTKIEANNCTKYQFAISLLPIAYIHLLFSQGQYLA